MRRSAALALLVLSAPAMPASRAPYGGTLRVAAEQDDVGVQRLLESGVCRLFEGRLQGVLATSVTATDPLHWRVKLRAELRLPSGAPLTASDVARAWQRLADSGTRSPYRGLLAPLRGQGASLSGAATKPDTLVLPLSYPFPDFAESLCHPALDVTVPVDRRREGLGPFRATLQPHTFAANLQYPLGRPYPDKLELLPGTDRRGDAQRFDVRLNGRKDGARMAPVAPLLATYLVYREPRVGLDFRRAFDGAVDVSQLAELFALSPSAAMTSLLPPGMMPQRPAPRPFASSAERRTLTLAFDEASPSNRAAAERIQLKLNERGFTLSLHPASGEVLRALWERDNFDALLITVLLPRAPAAALAVVLELAGRSPLAARELPALGALSDAAARARKTAERATALLPELPLIPLYAQGWQVELAARVHGEKVGDDGVPALDELFLSDAP